MVALTKAQEEKKDNELMHASSREERRLCIRELEEFARDYVLKWIGTQGESVKAEAWAILQAAEHLRDRL